MIVYLQDSRCRFAARIILEHEEDSCVAASMRDPIPCGDAIKVVQENELAKPRADEEEKHPIRDDPSFDPLPARRHPACTIQHIRMGSCILSLLLPSKRSLANDTPLFLHFKHGRATKDEHVIDNGHRVTHP